MALHEQENSTFGTCDVPPISPPPPAAATVDGNAVDIAYMDKPAKLLQSVGIILALTTFLAWL